MSKTCTGCKETQDISNFYRCAANPDGYNYRCKDCVREYLKGHRESQRRAQQKWREKNEGARKDYQRQWYLDNKERVLAQQAEYRRAKRAK